MKKIAIIGCGAIAGFVARSLDTEAGISVAFVVIQPGAEPDAKAVFGHGTPLCFTVEDFPCRPDLVLDCAGHAALIQHGEQILAAGIDLATVSSGALADARLLQRLSVAAESSAAQLRVVSGAIGALDVLSAARVGGLKSVIYRGRKPPASWLGSPAEDRLDLANLTTASVHFSGTAREAALAYPKNANVAASVALAGLGFDDTQVELIADPDVTENIHEVLAEGDFGSFEFRVRGRSLPDNPKSSALAAMSAVRELLNRVSPLVV